LILETAGVPIGKVGAKGEFVPLSASEKRATAASRWIISRRFSDQYRILEQRGEAGNPKSSYAALKGNYRGRCRKSRALERGQHRA
jgi:hypothetical protein